VCLAGEVSPREQTRKTRGAADVFGNYCAD